MPSRARVEAFIARVVSGAHDLAIEAFSTPDAPLPDPDTPAPARFLPAFENAVLGFDDRSRIVDDADRGLSVRGARFLLVDGRVAGTWTTRTGEGGALHVDVALHRPLTAPEREDVLQEGERLAAFLADGAPTGGARLAAP